MCYKNFYEKTWVVRQFCNENISALQFFTFLIDKFHKCNLKLKTFPICILILNPEKPLQVTKVRDASTYTSTGSDIGCSFLMEKQLAS